MKQRFRLLLQTFNVLLLLGLTAITHAKPNETCTLSDAKDAAEAAALRFIKGGEIIKRSREIKSHLSGNREIESFVKGPSGKEYWVYSRVDAMCKAVVLRRTY